MMDGEHPTDAGTAFATDDWSQFPAVDVPQSSGSQQSDSALTVPDGWHVETIPDRNGVPRQIATSSDGKKSIAIDDPGRPTPSGQTLLGWVDNGIGGLAPQFGYRDQPQPPVAGQDASASTDGQKDDWSQFPEAKDAPKPLSTMEKLGAGARAVVEGAGGVLDQLNAPKQLLGTAAHLAGLDGLPSPKDAADYAGLPEPQTDAEKAAFETVKGVSAAAPFAAAGGPIIPALVSGGAAGLAGEEARQAGYGPAAQLGASLLAGGVTGAGAAGVGTAGRRVFQSTEPSELLAAFQRQQVTPMAAQVGGFGAKVMNAGAKATLGGIPLARAAERSIESAKAARDRIAAGMGTVADDTGAGQAAQSGARSFIKTSEQRGGRLYDAIPIAPDKPAVLDNTRKALTELNQGLESNPELSKLWVENPRLQATLDAITQPDGEALRRLGIGAGTKGPVAGVDASRLPPKGLSWADLKRFRTIIGQIAGKPSLSADGAQIAAMKKLYGALSEDMRATAAADGPQSLRAFERANTYWRARDSRIDNTLKLILGNDYQKSAEGAFAQIDRWAREGGDAARLARTIRSLPPDEAATVRASIFARLGRAAPGQQNASVDAFSPSAFATQWAKLDHRAKSVLFPTAEYRQSLDDIAKISEAMKDSERFANTSRKALAERIGNNLLGATVVGYIMHPTAAIAGEGIGYSAGMLLGSPRFARWLASSPKKPVGAATLAHINRLSVIAAAEPHIANEVLSLQQRLASAFTNDNSATRAVANESGQKGSGVDHRQPQAQQQKQGGNTHSDDAAYQQWLKTYGIGEEPTYDTYAAFKSGAKPSARGHLTDEFKLPNHPTFSDESVHNGEGGKRGGKWIQTGGATKAQPDGIWSFKASPWNLQNMSKPALIRYFDHTEPGMTIIFPDGSRHTGKGAD